MNGVNCENIDGFNNLFNILNTKLYKKISIEEFNKIKNLVTKLLDIQKMTLDDIEYYVSGQSYTAIGIGDAVLKIGPEIRFVKNPYQLLPFHQEDLEDSNQKMYLCHRANSENLNRQDAQKLYNIIRDMGGLWVDPKENNLGTISKFSDINKFFENNVDYYDTGKQFSANNGNNYIIDFEDVIFLTPEIIQSMDKSNIWSTLPYGRNTSNRIYTEYLKTQDINEVYERNYIYPSETLLSYEQEYQKEKGNFEKVLECKNRLKEIENKRRQALYELKQREFYNRGSNIGKRYSAKEIGIQILQKTNLTRLKDIVSIIKNKFKSVQINSNKPKKVENSEIENSKIQNHEDTTDPWRTL